MGCSMNEYYAYFSDNHGEVKVIINLENKTLEWSAQLRNLDMITAMHIHCSPSNSIGVSFSTINFNLDIQLKGTVLTPDKGNMCGWLTFEDVKKSIEEGKAFVMVHQYSGKTYQGKLGAKTVPESKEIKGY